MKKSTKYVFSIAIIAMLVSMFAIASADSGNAILTDEKTIIVGDTAYISQTYTMEVSSDVYGGSIEFVKLFKEGRSPNVWIYMIPGDNMLGIHAYAHDFDQGETAAQKLIDGNFEGNYGFLADRLQDKKAGIVILNKVRAASVPAGLSNYSFTANWDLETYVNDFKKIVSYVSESTGTKKHIVVGHSRGGEIAQLYAGNNPNYLEGIITLDIVGEYDQQSQEYQNALITLSALENHIAQGNYVSDISGLLTVLWLSENYPNYPSPIPGFEFFTNEQLAFWMLENTGMLPGDLTPATGLPDMWYIKSYCEGDLFGLYYTNMTTLYEINGEGGFYPVTPLAVDKQGLEKRTHGGPNGEGLKVEFGNLKNNTFYVSANAQHGFARDTYTEGIVSAAHKSFFVIDGFGHLDILGL